MPVVATNDSHYLCEDDAHAQDVMVCIQTGKSIQEPNRMKFEGTGFYVKSHDEMYRVFKDSPAALGDSEGAREHVRLVFEDAVHLVVTLDIEAGTLELHPARLCNALAGLNTDHHILRASIVLAQLMTVVRSHQRQAQIFFEPKQSGVNVVFPFQALVLNLQKEIFFAKNVTVSPGSFTGGLVVVFHQALGHLTCQTAGEPN